MGKKKQAEAIRAGGKRFEVYNEGLCVYLYDEGNTDTLRKLIEKKGDPDEVFYDNMTSPAFAKAVSAKNLALTYELYQDDEIYVEVIVGQPLSDKELAVARWLPVQRAKLSLPTGRLRIDTPNTMPLDPEDNEDDGAVAEVPAGDYALGLYRVDWHGCECDEIEYKGPGEVIVLTPLAEAEPVQAGPPVLVFPEAPKDESWIGAYSINGQRFECQANYWDYWEWVRLNLDADAAAKLGLKCGSVLRITAGGLTIDAIYIDEFSRQEYMERADKAEFESKIKDRPEVAIGGWQEMGGRRVLAFFRINATTLVHTKFHEIWTPASGEVLSESFALPEEAPIPDATIEGDEVHAFVALANSELMIVNATQEQCASFGNTVKLILPHGTHTVALVEPKRVHNIFLTGKTIPTSLAFLKPMGLRTFARAGAVPKKAEEFNVEVLPETEHVPVAGLFPQEIKNPMSKYLHVRPMYVDGSTVGFDCPAPATVGTKVILKK